MQEQFIHLAANIVTANATGRGLSTDQIVEMIKSVACTLEGLSSAPATTEAPAPEEAKPAMAWQESITKNSITCLICGFKGTTLAAHITRKHHLNTKDYCAQFGIPSKIALVSKAYSAKRSQMAKDLGLGEHLQRAREAKKAAAGTQESAMTQEVAESVQEITAPAKPKAAKKSKKVTSAVKE